MLKLKRYSSAPASANPWYCHRCRTIGRAACRLPGFYTILLSTSSTFTTMTAQVETPKIVQTLILLYPEIRLVSLRWAAVVEQLKLSSSALSVAQWAGVGVCVCFRPGEGG